MYSEGKKEYRYRQGPNGEHLVEYGVFEWKKIDTLAGAVTKQDACVFVAELNTILNGTNAKVKP